MVPKPTRVTNRIRTLRLASGEMTQAELARRLGVTRQTVIAVEHGRYSPSLELAFQIAHIFGVPIDDVFRYEAADGEPGRTSATVPTAPPTAPPTSKDLP